MVFEHLAEATASLEKANADLQPELLSAPEASKLLVDYARAEKLASYGKTVLAKRVGDVAEVARASGTSVGKAKATVETGAALGLADAVRDAFQGGDISLDQAGEIAKAEQAKPGASAELLAVAEGESFHVLKERARKVALEAEQHRGLAERQHEARAARSYGDELGMIHLHLILGPLIGSAIVKRAETEAGRLLRRAKKEGRTEPFERHLCDAYAGMLSGAAAGASGHPELVVVVSHGVCARGWTDIQEGEVCKIPGIGPISPEDARGIAKDAFLTGVCYEGKDLRHMRRWTRNTPVEVLLALELGEPPDFDGIRCTDCGNRFGNQKDHLEPHCSGGPASTDNLKPRCWSCHKAKTNRDRKAGKLTPRSPDEERGPPRSC